VIASSGQAFTTLADFNQTNGAAPLAAMTQGFDGNLYGTTYGDPVPGTGILFKITTSGQLTTLYTFCSQFNCNDGIYPHAGVVQDQSGNFWGTTEGALPSYGFGTVFKITPGGALTTVHSFIGTDGEQPQAGLTLGSDGNFYGTTSAGGANYGGTVFKITPAGTLTTLHNFNYSDGNYPVSGLVQAANGSFYGTTLFSGPNGGGTVFKITAAGSLTTLYNFCSKSNCADGEFPDGTLIQAADGNLYGTTSAGGSISGCNNANCGTIFKITPAGAMTTLYNFCTESSCLDGGQPVVGLVQGTDGNFYGATTYGGANGDGTVFRISPAGKFTLLHTFDAVDGASPNGGLMQDTNGTFYGTTPTAGPGGYGTVFSLSVGLGPFVKTKATSGKEGDQISILGQGFSSSSLVSFGGVQASTIILTGTTFITATVPAAALTGPVTVTTGSTTLTSSHAFKVLPTITGFTPTSGAAGTSVVIAGTGLTQTTLVKFGSVKATSVTVDSDTQVTAVVPAGAITAAIHITTQGGAAASKTKFTVN
jgi:uncharacterized repeat protein (TIGR03803 family)